MKGYFKQFDHWNEVAKLLDSSEKKQEFHNGEIWWCSIGVNIGREECGKGFMFARPVLIFNKISDELFWGIPFTTTLQYNEKYTEAVIIEDKITYALIAQKTTYSCKRLREKIGNIKIDIYENIIYKARKIQPKINRNFLKNDNP